MKIKLKSNDRVFVAGKTGSGKSFLIKYILTGYPGKVIVYDEKNSFDLDNYRIVRNLSEFYLALDEYDKIKFVPDIQSIINDEDKLTLLENIFYHIYIAKNCLLVIDEAYSIFRSALDIPQWFKAILTRGRERNVGVICLTQRPAHIPVFVYSEAEHFFVFRLLTKNDISKLEAIFGDAIKEIRLLGQYEYLYTNVSRPTAHIFKLKRNHNQLIKTIIK